MTEEEIIKRCYEIYKPGMIYRNAYGKFIKKGLRGDNLGRGNNLAVLSDSVKFRRYEVKADYTFAIVDDFTMGGALYCDGFWADICNETGYIIFEVENGMIVNPELKEALKVIYKD